MQNRKGIVIVSFDLPTDTAKDKANYRKFRSFLIKNGFVFFQGSVYIKELKNLLQCKKVIKEASVNAPEKGNIVALPLTINELSKLSVIKGTENILSDLSEDVFFL